MGNLNLIQQFAPYFSNTIWQHARVLLLGAILVPGRRTVTAVLRIMGLESERLFENYHRVLNRATWSSLALSALLLRLLIEAFAPRWPVTLGYWGECRSRSSWLPRLAGTARVVPGGFPRRPSQAGGRLGRPISPPGAA